MENKLIPQAITTKKAVSEGGVHIKLGNGLTSNRTGISTTTISDWRKKNTNPGSDKIMAICAALEVTPEYLLSGGTEDSDRGSNVDYMVIPKGTEERELIELFNNMDWLEREHLLEYARRAIEK